MSFIIAGMGSGAHLKLFFVKAKPAIFTTICAQPAGLFDPSDPGAMRQRLSVLPLKVQLPQRVLEQPAWSDPINAVSRL
jgi:hypothetical protein